MIDIPVPWQIALGIALGIGLSLASLGVALLALWVNAVISSRIRRRRVRRVPVEIDNIRFPEVRR